MCNIAGYAGNDRAAPILLDMMRRQEGFAGGHYSGIATLHEGRLFHAKVTGNMATLCRETDVESFPGTTGIAHSRPALGGDDKWAHPFVNTAETFALVVNGHAGFFEDLDRQTTILRDLEQAGQQFTTRTRKSPGGHDGYPTLADGSVIHHCELHCHYIASLLDAGDDLFAAMAEGFASYPAEVVALALHADEPGRIAAARFNQPLTVGFCPGAVYLATTPLAFGPETDNAVIHPMPIGSAAMFTPRGMNVVPFAPAPMISSVFPYVDGVRAIANALADGDGKTIQDLKNATKDFWPNDRAPQKDAMVYEIVRSLLDRGTISISDEESTAANGKSVSRRLLTGTTLLAPHT